MFVLDYLVLTIKVFLKLYWIYYWPKITTEVYSQKLGHLIMSVIGEELGHSFDAIGLIRDKH